ncbi:hypothetical protein JZ751_022261 [Albula glossodonta]|uniref:Uncharacterized protein n=1 Tax=Albula glossodonta TaxID=121402 RepID=A0A8T2NJS9_9TELE|nr:hypothetical protein JZ751_022261 [Albula glossodonta]
MDFTPAETTAMGVRPSSVRCRHGAYGCGLTTLPIPVYSSNASCHKHRDACPVSCDHDYMAHLADGVRKVSAGHFEGGLAAGQEVQLLLGQSYVNPALQNPHCGRRDPITESSPILDGRKIRVLSFKINSNGGGSGSNHSGSSNNRRRLDQTRYLQVEQD